MKRRKIENRFIRKKENRKKEQKDCLKNIKEKKRNGYEKQNKKF